MAAKRHKKHPARRSRSTFTFADANFGARCLIREMRTPLLFFVGLFFIMFRPTMDAEKPFQFATIPGKLPKEVLPVEYSVRIVPKIDKFTFTGTETVKLSVRSPVRQLVMNSLELKITDASLDGKVLPKSAIKTDKKNELLTLALPSEFAAGDHTLALSFAGKINQQGQGLFYMPYREQASGTKKIMLGTQFEATDARRFFPCWDEPVFRARFQLTTVVPELLITSPHFYSIRKILLRRRSKMSTKCSPMRWRINGSAIL